MTTTAGTAGKLRIPLSIGDITKRVFLGKPLITEELATEKLSNPVALGALSPDAVTPFAPELEVAFRPGADRIGAALDEMLAGLHG